MAQLVLPAMRARRSGRIVNVGSMGGKLTFPGGGFYHATKYAVEALSDALRFEVQGFGIQVSLIEPGLIRTQFAETAVSSVDGAGDGAYARFNRAVAAMTVGAYEGPLARLGGGPESVAKTIERALTASSPKPRYPVTPSARLIMAQRRVMPDRVWDRFLTTQYPIPGRETT